MPLVHVLGNTSDAARILAIVALGYVVLHLAILIRRNRTGAVPGGRVWYAGVASINVAALVAVVATVVTGSIGAYELLLIVMLARPMFAFLLVLASFEKA